MSELNITSFEDLKRYSEGAIVELPPFAEGQPFVARLKRPSVMAMVSSGKIGNQLASIASEIFMDTVTDYGKEDMLSKMREVFVLVAKEELVEPRYDDIITAGVELTDEQLMFLYNYSQQGVNALKGFR